MDEKFFRFDLQRFHGGANYLDANGQSQSAEEAIALTGNETAIGTANAESWYVANANITFDHALTINGTVNLILTDGVTITVSGSTTNGNGVIDGGNLNVYGQTSGTGKLVVTNSGDAETGHGINVESYAQYGGNVEITAAKGSAIKSDGNVTIGGGTLTATTNGTGIEISTTGSYTQTGGNVNVNATGERSFAFRSSADVTISDGKLKLTATDRAMDVDSNGNIKISGGEITLEATAEDGTALSVYTNVEISGGTINATAKGKGGKAINIGYPRKYKQSGGTVTVTATGENGIGLNSEESDVEISGGNFTATGNKGINVDNNCTLTLGYSDYDKDEIKSSSFTASNRHHR